MAQKGEKLSEETKEKMRLSKLGPKNPMFGKHLSVEHKRKLSESASQSDSMNNNWKGDSAGYSAIHRWIHRKLGMPKLCENCGFSSENGRQFGWANLSHEYKRDLSDWMRLCISCHNKFDKGKIKLIKGDKTYAY